MSGRGAEVRRVSQARCVVKMRHRRAEASGDLFPCAGRDEPDPIGVKGCLGDCLGASVSEDDDRRSALHGFSEGGPALLTHPGKYHGPRPIE